jgi:hypothetical protein
VKANWKPKPKDPARHGPIKLRLRNVEAMAMWTIENKDRRMIAAFIELGDAVDFMEHMPLILD